VGSGHFEEDAVSGLRELRPRVQVSGAAARRSMSRPYPRLYWEALAVTGDGSGSISFDRSIKGPHGLSQLGFAAERASPSRRSASLSMPSAVARSTSATQGGKAAAAWRRQPSACP
jgi:hypothetical protein